MTVAASRSSGIRVGIPADRGGVDHMSPDMVARVAPPELAVLCLPGVEAKAAAAGMLAVAAASAGGRKAAGHFASYVGLGDYQVVVVPRPIAAGQNAPAPSADAALVCESATGRVHLKPAEYAQAAWEAAGADFVVGMHEALPCDQQPSRKRTMAETRSSTWLKAVTAAAPIAAAASARPASVLVNPVRAALPHPQENVKDAPEFPWTSAGVAGLSIGMGEEPEDANAYLQRCLSALTVPPIVVGAEESEEQQPRATTNGDTDGVLFTNAHSLIQLLDVLATVVTENRSASVVVAAGFPLHLAHRGIALVLPSTTAAPGPAVPTMVNMWDPALALDRSPPSEGCTCGTCRRHTRGYLHHLLRVHEMNADLLLYQHNLHVVATLVRRARAMCSDAAAPAPTSRAAVVASLLRGDLAA